MKKRGKYIDTWKCTCILPERYTHICKTSVYMTFKIILINGTHVKYLEYLNNFNLLNIAGVVFPTEKAFCFFL